MSPRKRRRKTKKTKVVSARRVAQDVEDSEEEAVWQIYSKRKQ